MASLDNIAETISEIARGGLLAMGFVPVEGTVVNDGTGSKCYPGTALIEIKDNVDNLYPGSSIFKLTVYGEDAKEKLIVAFSANRDGLVKIIQGHAEKG